MTTIACIKLGATVLGLAIGMGMLAWDLIAGRK